MSHIRRQKREKERLMVKLHKQFLERIKGMSEEQVKNYVNKQVEKYKWLNGNNNQPDEQTETML